MAFKMKRPLKMKAPLKRAGLNIGRTTDNGLYYNSDMGPMKMHSPSALKQMEEEMAAGGGGGMEEMMGMMGGMEGMEGEAPVEGGAPTEEPTTDPDEGKAEHIQGQEIEVVGDNKYQIDVEDLGYGIAGLPEGQDVIEVLDPDGVLGNKKKGEYVVDEDYTWEVEDGKVIIIGLRVLKPGE
jgi:hypothetical protein